MENVENETNLKLKCLKSDNGGEYCGEFRKYCADNMEMEKTIFGTPHQKGIAEMMSRILNERARYL